jgi:hypothetical protein
MGFDLMESINLYFTCINYINGVIDNYIKLAEELEEYEALSNLIKFKALRDQDTKNYF